MAAERALGAQDRSGVSGTVRSVVDYLPAHSAPAVAAVTRTDSKIAASFNGPHRGLDLYLVNRLFRNTAGLYGDMTLKKLVIYPAQADADLPGLST